MQILKNSKKTNRILLSFVFVLIITLLLFLLISLSLEKDLIEQKAENLEQGDLIAYYEELNIEDALEIETPNLQDEESLGLGQELLKENRENYLRENISDLSSEPAVLGGTFYVTEIIWIENNLALVEYEDGHIALSAEALFIENDSELILSNFSIIN